MAAIGNARSSSDSGTCAVNEPVCLLINSLPRC